jgi:hypothetical protein
VASWLSDHWEFVVGTAVAILGIVVGIAIALWQRQPKTLDYEVVNKLPILSPNANLAWETPSAPLVVLYGDQKIKDPFLLTVRVRNTGKRAIEAGDYADPITVTCTGSRPFDGFINQVFPQELRVADDPRSLAQLAALRPPLLNPGDWFELQFLTDGDPAEITVRSRFKDQARSMQEIGSVDSPSGILMWTALSIMILGLWLLIAFPNASGSVQWGLVLMPYVGSAMLGFLWIRASLWRRRRARKH